MNSKRDIQTASLVICLGCAALSSAQSFSYQGQLNDNGQPANGTYAIRFRLLDAAMAGNQVGPTLSSPSMPVEGGLFSTSLNFGTAPFNAAGGRWLEVAVAPAGTPNYTVLSPRQRLDAAPRALTLEWPASGSAATGQTMFSLNNASSGVVVDATNSGTGVAVRAAVSSAASSANALVATNAGGGRAFLAQANGTGTVAEIRNVNSANPQTVLKVSTSGDGTVAEFNANHAANNQPAVIVRNAGDGPALVCESSAADAPALKIEGPITLVGDSALFTVHGGPNDNGFIRLDHPLLNNNPAARIFVQPRTHPTFNQARLVYPDYVDHEGQWRLKSFDGGILLDGFAWDVLVFIKQSQ